METEEMTGMDEQVNEQQELAPPPPEPEITEPEGINIPKPRFDQVNNELRTWKEFGKPDEVREKLERLAAYDNRLKAYRENSAKTPDQQESERSRSEIRRQMEEVYPELKDLQRLQTIVQTNISRASGHLAQTLKSQNLEFTEEEQGEIEDYLWSRMTPQEQEALKFGDFSVIDRKITESKLLTRLKPIPPAPPPPAPKRHQTGGTPPKGETKPANWKDADEVAWGIMKES